MAPAKNHKPNPKTKSKPTSNRQRQTSIATFFTSPKKQQVQGGNNVTAHPRLRPPAPSRTPSIISIRDSDDESIVLATDHHHDDRDHFPDTDPNRDQVESDAELARRLARDWDTAAAIVVGSSSLADVTFDGKIDAKGKGKARAVNDEDEDGFKIEHVSPPLTPIQVKFELPTDSPGPSKLHASENMPVAHRTQRLGASRNEPVEAIDFDVDSFLFDPNDVHIDHWPRGRLPYSVLVGVYIQVARTRSRLLIVRVLTNFLRLLLSRCPVDLPPALYLLSNHLRPAYLPCELGVGWSILSRAIKDVSGLASRDLRRLWERYGDPGDVAHEAKSNLRTLIAPPPLLVHDVYRRLLALADMRGQQSGKLKGDAVRKLMVQARGEEVRYIVRTLIGNLRIGAVRLTLLTALARAAALLAAPPELAEVKPVPEKGKKPLDPAREAIEARCLDAIRTVRRVYVRHPNYGNLISGLELGGLDRLADRVPVCVGIPLSPMLGSITRSLDEVFARLGSLPFTAETKLDGQRLQMHVRVHGPQGEDDGGGRWVEGDSGRVWVRLFSRHLEDMTEKYPDICALALTLVTRALGIRTPYPSTASTPSQQLVALLDTTAITSFIIDAEIVAVDKDTGVHRTFQELTNRAKKDVKVEDIKVVVEVCAFDLMLLNDVPLLPAPFSHRRHLLRTLLVPFIDRADPMLARFSHVESVDSADLRDPQSDLRTFFDHVVEQKAEGLMVKLLESGEGLAGDDDEDDGGNGSTAADEAGGSGPTVKSRKKALPATYEPDQRSQGWLKVKKDYLEGMGDSLDVVPIGAWWGNGRKAGWWSPILLAVSNPETGALEAVCKCISGFTDAFYKDLLLRYPPEGRPDVCSKVEPLGYVETGRLVPDVWFLPSEVWEIRGADITSSPVYPASATHLGGERGLSLRFPRFIRRRDDKSIDEATTAEQFADMFRRQMARPPAPRAAAVILPPASDDESDEEGDPGEAAFV